MGGCGPLGQGPSPGPDAASGPRLRVRSLLAAARSLSCGVLSRPTGSLDLALRSPDPKPDSRDPEPHSLDPESGSLDPASALLPVVPPVPQSPDLRSARPLVTFPAPESFTSFLTLLSPELPLSPALPPRSAPTPPPRPVCLPFSFLTFLYSSSPGIDDSLPLPLLAARQLLGAGVPL